MDRGRVAELHYITPIGNLPSIMERGILSKKRADPLGPETVADPDVQDIREGKSVPQGRPLHEYANLYFDARNPMMYRRFEQRKHIAVLRVTPEVLLLPDVVIADGNAASTGTSFQPSPEGLDLLDEERVYAEYWTDSDFWTYVEKKRQRCAEVLVPDHVPVEYLRGCYVCTDGVRTSCERLALALTIEVAKRVFFS